MNWIQALGARILGLEAKAGPSGPVFVGASQDGKPVTTEWDAEKAVTQGLKANTWVYAAVSKVATGFASVPLVLEQLKNDAWTADPTHEIQVLLDRPNDHMARQDVMERWTYHMLLTGNALWLKTMSVSGKPIELWPVLPQQIKPIPSRRDFLAGYEYKPTTQDKTIKKPEEVAHWMFVDPNNPYWGLAPLQAAAAAVDTDIAASTWQRQLLGKGGRPAFIVMLEKDMPTNRQKEAQAFINEQVGGGRSVTAAVMGGATRVVPLSLNALELDYLNSRKFTREEVAAAFGVPPVLLSFGEAATFANLDAAKTALWEDRIVPLLEDFTQGLMATLFPHWGLTQAGWRIRADLSGVRALQSNLRTQADVVQVKATTLKTLVEAGVPINVARAFLDLDMPDIEGGDAPRPPTPQGQPPPAGKAARRLQRKDKGDPVTPEAQLARRDGWEGEIRKKVASLLLEAGDTYASAYADGSLDGLDQSVELSADSWQALLEATHQAVIEAEGGIAYTAALKAITGQGGGGAFDVLADGVTSWIDDHTADAVKGITTTTRDALRGVVRTGVSNGDSVRDIAKAIKAQCTTWSDARATLVARTEVATAFGAAHQLSAQQIQDDLGVEMVKTWHATEDSRTRPEHAAMDGETVAIDAAFSNGLDYPGEPNCRCVVTFDQKGG